MSSLEVEPVSLMPSVLPGTQRLLSAVYWLAGWVLHKFLSVSVSNISHAEGGGGAPEEQT